MHVHSCIFTWLVTYHGLCSHSPSVLEVQGGLLNLYLPNIQTKTDTKKYSITHSSLYIYKIYIYAISISILCSLRAHLFSCWTWKASVTLKNIKIIQRMISKWHLTNLNCCTIFVKGELNDLAHKTFKTSLKNTKEHNEYGTNLDTLIERCFRSCVDTYSPWIHLNQELQSVLGHPEGTIKNKTSSTDS